MAATGIYKRGGVWWIRYTGIDGKQKRESTRSDKYQDAVILLGKRKGDIANGKEPEVTKVGNFTFRDLVGEYHKWAERQRSYRTKSTFIDQLSEAFGDLPLRRFNTMLVEQFQTERLKQGKKKVRVGNDEWQCPGNSAATVNRLIATLKHMFTKAVDWNMVEEGTLKKVRKVKLIPENNRRLRYLSREECEALVEQCNDHTKTIVQTALNTGMRKGEILSLTWDNVDMKHGFILLDKTKNGERREIPINGTLRAVFQSLVRRLDVPYLFFDPATGKPYQDVKRSFNRACRRAGIRDFHFHDLRHTFASHLVMGGADITTVKELLGHKTLTMTLRYAHLAPAHKVKAVEILDAAINGKTISTKLAQSES
jgi:integrase